MTDFQMMDSVLTESKLLRSTRFFNSLTGRQIADLLYINTLVVYMLAQDDEQAEFAKQYAQKTQQYGTYTLFRTHATDLYLLAYTVLHPQNDMVKLRDPASSKDFLNSLMFDRRRHKQFLQSIAAARDTASMASSYLYRLESQLRIKNSNYKRWRRLVLRWKTLRYSEKQYVLAQITQELRRLGVGAASQGEINPALASMFKQRKYIDTQRTTSNTGKKIAGAALGAVAGRYAADKLNRASNSTAKNIGTGLGAIAGYWAAGREKK